MSDLRRSPPIPFARNASPADSLIDPNGWSLPLTDLAAPVRAPYAAVLAPVEPSRPLIHPIASPFH